MTDNKNYCVECRRIFDAPDECAYCKSKNIKVLAKKAPVNVIGTKLKGRVLKAVGSGVQILFIEENQSKTIRSYPVDKLRKIL